MAEKSRKADLTLAEGETDFIQMSKETPSAEWTKTSETCQKELVDGLTYKESQARLRAVNGVNFFPKSKFIIMKVVRLLGEYIEGLLKSKEVSVEVDVLEPITQVYHVSQIAWLFNNRGSIGELQITEPKTIDDYNASMQDVLKIVESELQLQPSHEVDAFVTLKNNERSLARWTSAWKDKKSLLFQISSIQNVHSSLNFKAIEGMLDKDIYCKVNKHLGKVSGQVLKELRDRLSAKYSEVDNSHVGLKLLLGAVTLQVHAKLIKDQQRSEEPFRIQKETYNTSVVQQIIGKFSTQEFTDDDMNTLYGFARQQKKLADQKKVFAQFIKANYSNIEAKNMVIPSDSFGSNLLSSCLSCMSAKPEAERTKFIDLVLKACGDEKYINLYEGLKNREKVMQQLRLLDPAVPGSQLKIRPTASKLTMFLFDPKSTPLRDFLNISGSAPSLRKCLPADQKQQAEYYQKAIAAAKVVDESKAILHFKNWTPPFKLLLRHHIDLCSDGWLAWIDQIDVKDCSSRLFPMAAEIASNVITADNFKTIVRFATITRSGVPPSEFVKLEPVKMLKELFLLSFEGWKLVLKVKQKLAGKEPWANVLNVLEQRLPEELLVNQILFYAVMFNENDKATALLKEFKLGGDKLPPIFGEIQQDVMKVAFNQPIHFTADDKKDVESELVYYYCTKHRFQLKVNISTYIVQFLTLTTFLDCLRDYLTQTEDISIEIANVLGATYQNLKHPLLRLLSIYKCLHNLGVIRAATAYKWISDVLSAMKQRVLPHSRDQKALRTKKELTAMGKVAIEVWAISFIAGKAAGDDTVALMQALDENVGRANLTKCILKYVAVNFQRGGAGSKSYCGYLINNVLKKFYDEAEQNPDAPKLISNAFMKNNDKFSENTLLKPIFSSQGRLDISTEEFLQILSLTSLSDYLVLAHSSALTDNEKLHNFFVGDTFDSISSGLKLEVAKMMKLPGSNPKYLKAMCSFFNLDPLILNSKPTTELVKDLIKIGDLDFDQLVSGMWSQLSESGRLSTFMAAVRCCSLRKLAVCFKCDSTAEVFATFLKTNTKTYFEQEKHESTKGYELIASFYGSFAKLLAVAKLVSIGYSESPDEIEVLSTFTVANFENFKSLSAKCISTLTAEVSRIIKRFEDLNKRKSDGSIISSLCRALTKYVQITSMSTDKSIYIFLREIPVDSLLDDQNEHHQALIQSGPDFSSLEKKYSSRINKVNEIFALVLQSMKDKDYPNDNVENGRAGGNPIIFQEFVRLTSKYFNNIEGSLRKEGAKETQRHEYSFLISTAEILTFVFNSSETKLIDSCLANVPYICPKPVQVCKFARKLKDPAALIAKIENCIAAELKHKPEEGNNNEVMAGLYFLVSLIVCTFSKESAALGSLLQLKKKLPIPPNVLEMPSLVYLMEEKLLRENSLASQFNEANWKSAQDFCKLVLTESYTLNSKRNEQEKDNTTYLGIIEVAEKHKETLGKDPSPLTKLEFKVSKDTSLAFSDSLIKKLFSGKPEEGMVMFMKACLSWDETVVDLERPQIVHLYKRAAGESLEPNNFFNPFNQVKRILVCSFGEKPQLGTLEAVLEVDINIKMVMAPAREYSTTPMPDAKSQNHQVMNVSSKKVLRVRVEDATYTFDPSIKLHPSYYELRSLRQFLDRMTKETRTRYGEENLSEAVAAGEDPFQRRATSLANYADRKYFQSSFGEAFANEPFMNQRFMREYKLYKNIDKVLTDFENACFKGLDPKDVIAANASLLGAVANQKVEQEVYSIQTNLYEGLPPRVQ